MIWFSIIIFIIIILFIFYRRYSKSRDYKAFNMNVVGESFNNEDGSSRQKVISSLYPGDTITLNPEPNNPYDNHAVAVISKKGQIGYLPQGRCHDVFNALQRGESVQASVEKITGGTRGKPSRGVVLLIEKPN